MTARDLHQGEHVCEDGRRYIKSCPVTDSAAAVDNAISDLRSTAAEIVAEALVTLVNEGDVRAIPEIEQCMVDPGMHYDTRTADVVICTDPGEDEPTPVPLVDIASDALADLRDLVEGR